jgi:hypothetical protein
MVKDGAPTFRILTAGDHAFRFVIHQGLVFGRLFANDELTNVTRLSPADAIADAYGGAKGGGLSIDLDVAGLNIAF